MAQIILKLLCCSGHGKPPKKIINICITKAWDNNYTLHFIDLRQPPCLTKSICKLMLHSDEKYTPKLRSYNRSLCWEHSGVSSFITVMLMLRNNFQGFFFLCPLFVFVYRCIYFLYFHIVFLNTGSH